MLEAGDVVAIAVLSLVVLGSVFLIIVGARRN